MSRRMMRRVLIAVVAIVLLALAWWLGSPLFLNRTVDEPFPTERPKPGPIFVQADAVPLLAGEFRDADDFHRGSGKVTLYLLDDGRLFLRLENFTVTNGPDLHVILSSHPDPADQEEVNSGAYLDLGNLKGNVGNQNYEVPGGTDLSSVRSVVIYCKPFHVVFSTASLETAF